jgi:hypothetical protein
MSYKDLLEGITGDTKAPLVESKKESKKEDAKDNDDSSDKDPKNFFDKFKKKKKGSVSESEYIAFLEQLIESTLDYDSESLQEAASDYYDTL